MKADPAGPSLALPLVYIHGRAAPSPEGASVVAHRLLSRLAPRELETFTDLTLWRRVWRDDLTLPGRYHFVPRLPRWANRPFRAVRVLQVTASFGLAVLCGVVAARVAQRRRAGWILSVADDGFSVVAGSVCSRLSRAPHVIWVFDPWEENAYNDVERWLASRLESRIWRNAAAVVVHAEQLGAHYLAKHGVRCAVLPTPVELNGARPAGRHTQASAPDSKEVLVAGSIYWVHEEAIRRLARVCRRMDGVRLTIVGDPEMLRADGIDADRYEPALPPDRIQARLREAHALVMGLGFETDAPLVVRTATPARLADYMASGTPILIHAPPGSYAVEYARREGFAWVVDQPDDAALEAGLRDLFDDPERTAQRAQRARELAVTRHDVELVREQMLGVLARARRRVEEKR